MMRGIVVAMAMLAAGLPSTSQAEDAKAQPVLQQGARPDAAKFATLPFVERAVMSPDGQWIGGLFAVGGQRRICIISIFGTAAPRCVAVPEMTEPGGLEWVNDDNLLIHVTQLIPVEADRWYVHRVINFNRVSGKITRLLWDAKGQTADDVLWTARDGSPMALIAAQDSIYLGEDFWPTVYRVNVETGVKSRALKGYEDVMHWEADAEGEVRLGYGYSDAHRTSRLLYRANRNDLFRVIDRADDRKREDLIQPVGFGSAPDSVLVIRNDEDKRSSLFDYDLRAQKDLRKLWTAPEGSWITSVIMAEDGKTVLGVRLAGKQRERVWLDPALAELQAAFAKSVPESRVSITSFSRDRQRMLVQIDRADTPGAIYFFDQAGSSLQRISYISEELHSTPLNPVSAVTYKARDGLEIEAILTLPKDYGPKDYGPKGREAKKLPVVVMPHGGPWNHDTLDYDYWAQFVAGLGYAVIQPNFRGSTGYGEAFERKGEGQMGLAMQDDLNDALKYLVDQGIGDGARACIVGASYGGYATMWGLARDAGLWRCGISISGVASVRREVNDMSDSLTGNANRAAWTRMTPDFSAVSPLNFVDRIKAPLLLVHGKMDVTVDHSQSASMASRMKAAGKPYEFVSLPKADHYFTREADRLALLQAMEAFLKKYNPPDAVGEALTKENGQ